MKRLLPALMTIGLFANACASVSAVRDPDIWVPAAAAIAVAATGVDEGIAEWAAEETPLFGSTDTALEMSNHLKGALRLLMFGTSLTPNRDGHPLAHRALTAAENELASLPTDFLTDQLKSSTGRPRPDGSDENSFPSGHASTAGTYAAMTERNLQHADVGPRTRRALVIASRILAAGTAWARVEAKKHYPTDVLAGLALGNLLNGLLERWFVGRWREQVHVVIDPAGRGVKVLFRLRDPRTTTTRCRARCRDSAWPDISTGFSTQSKAWENRTGAISSLR